MKFRIYRTSDEQGAVQPYALAVHVGEEPGDVVPATFRTEMRGEPGKQHMENVPVPESRKVMKRWYIEICSPEDLLAVVYAIEEEELKRHQERSIRRGRPSAWPLGHVAVHSKSELEDCPTIEIYDGWYE